MEFETSKYLGAIGALLMVIGPLISFAYGLGGLVGFIGLILLLIGLKGFADYFKEGGIFNNWLYGIIIMIVGAVIAVVVFVVGVIASLASIGFGSIQDIINDPSGFAAYFADVAHFDTILGFIWGLVAALVIFWILFIVAAFFIRRSLSSMSAKSGVGLFGTAGLLILIGAVLTVVIIGLLIFWIGMILLTAAFFQMRRPLETPPQAAAPPPTQ